MSNAEIFQLNDKLILNEIHDLDLQELKENGILEMRKVGKYMLVATRLRLNVHRIKEQKSEETIDNQAYYNSIKCLGPLVDQFADFILFNNKHVYTRRENLIYRNELFKWGEKKIIHVPVLLSNKDLIRISELRITKKIVNIYDFSDKVNFTLLNIYNDKLIYFYKNQLFFDTLKIELNANKFIGYKKWIIGVDKKVIFYNLKQNKINFEIKRTAEKIKLFNIMNEEFLQIDNLVFYKTKQICHTKDFLQILDMNHTDLMIKFIKKYSLYKWFFSINVSIFNQYNQIFNQSGLLIENIGQYTEIKNEMILKIESIYKDCLLEIIGSLKIEIYKCIQMEKISDFKALISGLKILVHSYLLKYEYNDTNTLLIMIFYILTNDIYFLHIIINNNFLVSNKIRLFFINDIFVENKRKSFRLLRDTTRRIFKCKLCKNKKKEKLVKKIIAEITKEDKIKFSDFDLENKRKKACILRKRCFIGDSLIGFLWNQIILYTTVNYYKNEDLSRLEKKKLIKIPNFHLKLRNNSNFHIRNDQMGMRMFESRFYSLFNENDFKTRRLQYVHSKKINSALKEIMINESINLNEESTNKQNEYDLLNTLLTCSNPSVKILEEKILDENSSKYSRIVNTVIYCLKERKNSIAELNINKDILFSNKEKTNRNSFLFNNSPAYENNSFNESVFPTFYNDNDHFTFIEVKDSLISLLLNGMLNLRSSSTINHEKLKRAFLVHRPEELFFSELFSLISQTNQKNTFFTDSEISKLLEFTLENYPQAYFFGVAGRIFFIAIYFLFFHSGDIQLLKSTKKTLLNKCIKWEELMKKNENVRIIFNYSLITLSLLETLSKTSNLNVSLLRIIRRKILETKETKNYDSEETFYINILDNDHNTDIYDENEANEKYKLFGNFSNEPIHYGYLELYKMCLGLSILKFKSLIIKGTINYYDKGNRLRRFSSLAITSILYLILSFYPVWPICPSDQIDFHQVRNVIFLIFEKREENYCFLRKNRDCDNYILKKYISDILCDYGEKSDDNVSVWNDLIKMVVNDYK